MLASLARPLYSRVAVAARNAPASAPATKQTSKASMRLVSKSGRYISQVSVRVPRSMKRPITLAIATICFHWKALDENANSEIFDSGFQA